MNPRTGIVRRITRFVGETGDAPVAVAGADLGDLAPLGGGAAGGPAGGVGTSWREAENAAIGEAFERYAAAFVRREALRVDSIADMPQAVPGWALFTDRQHAHPAHTFARWTGPTRIGWMRAARLDTNGRAQDLETAWVPAQFVHLPYPLEGDEELLAPGTSTGLAAASDVPRAILAGLYEVIERDAFTLAWLHGAVPPRVATADLPADARALAAYGDLNVFDLTADTQIPTYLAVLEQPTALGVVRVVGAAARHAATAACRKAVLEAFQTVPYVRDLARHEPDWRAGARFENLRDFRDHARFYTMHPEHRVGLAHLLDGPFEAAIPPAERSLRAPLSPRAAIGDLVERLQRVGLAVYAVRLTTPDVAACGHEVVRVLVPGAQPLHGFHQIPHLESDRFRRAHEVLPYLDAARTEEEVNPWPHPFA